MKLLTLSSILLSSFVIYSKAQDPDTGIGFHPGNISNPSIHHRSKRSPAAAFKVISSAINFLKPFAQSIYNDIKAQKNDESVTVRVWMHNGDPKLHGCGFYFKVIGYRGSENSGFFPGDLVHNCPNGEAKFRLTKQSSSHWTKLHLGNEQAKQVELHADGWENTFVNTLCFGFNINTIAGGPRSFCINQQLLRGCKALYPDRFRDFDFFTNDIQFTKSNRRPGGLHKIVVREVSEAVKGFEQLDRKENEWDGMYKVCDRIDVIRANEGDRYTCWALGKQERNGPSCAKFGMGCYTFTRQTEINPYGC